MLSKKNFLKTVVLAKKKCLVNIFSFYINQKSHFASGQLSLVDSSLWSQVVLNNINLFKSRASAGAV